MRALADNLQAVVTILQAMLTIVSMTLTIIMLVKLRRLINFLKGIPGTLARAPGAAWDKLTGRGGQ